MRTEVVDQPARAEIPTGAWLGRQLRLASAVGVLVPLLAVSASAQQSGLSEDGSSPRTQTQPDSGAAEAAGSSPPKSPAEAYQAGFYDQAAAGFARRAERRPNDPRAQFNLGSALHELNDYDGAKAAFERALSTDERSLRAKALYDLGNTAFRQGRLEEAIDRYQESLDLAPDDEDAKHNLEFVQRELERRQEQAQQRQQQNQDQDQNSDQQDQNQQQGEQQQDQQQQEQQGQDQNQQDPNQQDSDGDGLSDQQERNAENPTDPNRADSDGDGRSDGEEDKNRNGRVDEGESNPNRPDEAPEGDPNQPSPEEQQSEGEEPGEQREAPSSNLTPEQAERLLAALQDRRPRGGRKVPEDAKRTKSAKDW